MININNTRINHKIFGDTACAKFLNHRIDASIINFDVSEGNFQLPIIKFII